MEVYAIRSELGNCCPCPRAAVGSGRLRSLNPRFTEPSGFMLPLCESAGGEPLSDSGDPIELLATSIPPICDPWAAGTTRFRLLITDFFIVTGRCTPWSL